MSRRLVGGRSEPVAAKARSSSAADSELGITAPAARYSPSMFYT